MQQRAAKPLSFNNRGINDNSRLAQKEAALQKYTDPILCPTCFAVFGEWEKVKGTATIKKLCPRCKEYKFISKTA